MIARSRNENTRGCKFNILNWCFEHVLLISSKGLVWSQWEFFESVDNIMFAKSKNVRRCKKVWEDYILQLGTEVNHCDKKRPL